MKKITLNTKLRQNNNIFSAVEVDGVIYWIDPKLPIEEDYPNTVIEKLTTGEHMLWQIDNIHDIDRSCQYQIVAQSERKIEEKPIITLNIIQQLINEYRKLYYECPKEYKQGIQYAINIACNYLKLKNNQYTQKDIEKAIEFGYELLRKKTSLTDYNKQQILAQINSISIIEVDVDFNIIRYK